MLLGDSSVSRPAERNQYNMEKILVANRGEIACRVLRSAKRMGIRTVAVYSEVDRNAPHVLMADEAVLIGPAPSAQSYLDGNRIIAAALALQVHGIHPGYGFLSENASFAEQVRHAGMTFIGPSPSSIRTMGSKIAAKNAVKAFDIPMVPGTDHAVKDTASAVEICESIGYPVLIKASAGGGGKGMRVVKKAAELPEQMERAVSEATSAFGDGAVFLEKYIESPRHIEIQVLADNHGRVVHLFERECSIQRRHQKVIEEAPSIFLTPSVRAAMGEAAIQVAKACQYTGAGTVEFLVDSNRGFYFLEMNTRLQVEHPVTELITGIDLVEQQIRIARNEPLPFVQEDLRINGHAIELRVCAEDPREQFLPATGFLTKYSPPAGEGIRLDDGYRQGMEVPVHYDPLLGKLCAHGPSRSTAIRRMLEAIRDFQLEGVPTTLPFGRFVLEHPAFLSGDIDTHFIDRFFDANQLSASTAKAGEIAAAVAWHHHVRALSLLQEPGFQKDSPWGKR
ncbi:MAG: hypothetical protein RLY31_2012 [Bacteroidota bacterium]|jgi:propionyl-CoA carboxylase alpha chain